MYMRWSLSRRVRQSTCGKLDAPGAFPGFPDARERSLTVAARNRAARVSERFFGSKDLFLGRKEIAADGKAKNKTGKVRIRLGAALGEYVVQAQRKFVAGGVTDRPYARNWGLATEYQVIGVAQDLRGVSAPTAYTDGDQDRTPTPFNYRTYYLRTASDPAPYVAILRQILRGLDRNMPVSGLKTLAQEKADSLAQERLLATVSGFFGVLARLLQERPRPPARRSPRRSAC